MTYIYIYIVPYGSLNNQSSGIPDRRESLKLWRINLKQWKYCNFFIDSQLTWLIQKEQNTAISGYFIKPTEYARTMSGSGCMDK